MKRPQNKDRPKDVHSTGDIKRDLTEKQLAAIGAVTLAYNVLEDQIDALMFAVTGIPDWLFPEVSSRIHGLDGKTAIIQAAAGKAGLKPKDLQSFKDALGTFGDFKKNRDAIIHARIINAAAAIGLSAKTRGTAFEILLSEDALNVFYDHIVALDKELSSVGPLMEGKFALNSIATDDPNRARLEEETRVHQAQFHQNRSHRRSLKPMPKFPTESELNEAVTRWRGNQQAALMDWFQPLSQPWMHPNMQRPMFSNAMWLYLQNQPPPPPDQEPDKPKPDDPRPDKD